MVVMKRILLNVLIVSVLTLANLQTSSAQSSSFVVFASGAYSQFGWEGHSEAASFMPGLRFEYKFGGLAIGVEGSSNLAFPFQWEDPSNETDVVSKSMILQGVARTIGILDFAPGNNTSLYLMGGYGVVVGHNETTRDGSGTTKDIDQEQSLYFGGVGVRAGPIRLEGVWTSLEWNPGPTIDSIRSNLIEARVGIALFD